MYREPSDSELRDECRVSVTYHGASWAGTYGLITLGGSERMKMGDLCMLCTSDLFNFPRAIRVGKLCCLNFEKRRNIRTRITATLCAVTLRSPGTGVGSLHMNIV